MSKPNCHYVFLARTAYKNSQTNEIEFVVNEKKFENENPIFAREAVFNYRNEFLRGMLTEGIGLTEDEIGWNPIVKEFEKLSEREIRKLTNPFLEPGGEKAWHEIIKEGEWKAPDDTLGWYPKFNNGIWIIMKHNDEKLHKECYNDDDIVIDKISRYEEPLPSPPNYMNLEEELKFYKKYDHDTLGYETSIVFFDDENYIEGFIIYGDETEEEAQELHQERSIRIVNCLKTPFDWTGYDEINWWEEDSNEDTNENVESLPEKHTLTITMQEALDEQENHFCEFKPGLINWSNSTRNIEYEVAQAICAFLNAKGGYLFIGIADNGEIKGLDFSRISKDEFKRAFTRIKTRHLPPHIAHTIYGDFYPVNEKEIFAITIYPSRNEPIFLRKKDENTKLLSKEFYVRSDAASRHIYDVEEIVKYCKNHWQS